jgi:hypothetical protein
MTPKQDDIIQKLAQMDDVAYVKQDSSRIVLNESGNIPSQSQADAVLYFFQLMDIDMIKLILDDANTYQNFEKNVFIKKLDYVFHDLLQAGNTFLNRHKGVCNSVECNFKCKGYSFIGNVSYDHIDFIFDIRDNRVFDIYECDQFKCTSEIILQNKNLSLDSDMPF